MLYHKIETVFKRNEKTKKFSDPLEFSNPVHSLIGEWEFTEKIDGTNIRVMWKENYLTFGGRTENADIPSGLLNWLNANVRREKLLEIFPDQEVYIFGEGYGGKIQAGHGYGDEQKLIVFDVRVGDWWLKREDVMDVSEKLGLDVVPFIGSYDLDKAVEFVREGFQSRIGTCPAEGLIGRTAVPLFDGAGKRLIIKLKTKDFQ